MELDPFVPLDPFGTRCVQGDAVRNLPICLLYGMVKKAFIGQKRKIIQRHQEASRSERKETNWT